MQTSSRMVRVTWLLSAGLAQARRLTGSEDLCRVAIATYDPGTGMVSAFAHSGEDNFVLDTYSCLLREAPGLMEMARDGRPRVIDDLTRAPDDDADHAGAVRGAGYHSSLTIPLLKGGELAGFVFFNAKATAFFTPELVERLTAFITDMPRFLMRELERHVDA